MYYDILPTPKKYRDCGQSYSFGNRVKVGIDTALHSTLAAPVSDLQECFRQFHQTDLSMDENGDIQIALCDNEELQKEGYVLRITENGISITASTGQGIFYGIQTLIQIIKQCHGRSIRCLEITDYPDVSLRAVLIDLRFQTFYIDYLIKQIKLWAHYKINTINIDYSSNFPYQGEYEVIRGANAFTEAEIRLLTDTCKQYFVEIIPIVQSFGHMEYLLEHPKFRHLNEGGFENEFFSQCCPSDPEAFKASIDLISQVLKAHDNPRYISIGGDETFHLGKCEKCAAYAEEHGKGMLYASYINKLADAVINMGAKPIVYCDMMLAYPEIIDVIDKRITVGDWDYWTISSEPVLMQNWSEKKQVPIEEVDSFSEPLKTLVIQHLIAEDKTHYHPFGYTKYLMGCGFDVIGHPSTASVGPDDLWTPQYDVHAPNIKEFCCAVKEYGAAGVICTAWERFLMETTIYGVAYAAEFSWGSAIDGNKGFNRRFCMLQYGVEDSALADSMYLLSRPYTLVEKRYPRVYIADRHDRIDKPLPDIINDHEVIDNIETAAATFAKYRVSAAYNNSNVAQWQFGVDIKRFWRQIAEVYQSAIDHSHDEGHIQHLVSSMDTLLSGVKQKAYDLLKSSMPEQSLIKRVNESFKTCEVLKQEIVNRDFRVGKNRR